MNKKIAKIVIGLPIEGHFDYKVGKDFQDNVAVGKRVWIFFRGRKRVGYVVGLSQRSKFKNLNPILSVIDDIPIIDSNLMKLTKQFSEYYSCFLGESIESTLPRMICNGKEVNIASGDSSAVPLPHRPLKALLHDPSFTKGWPFIIKKIQETLDKKQGVICLVPEVSMVDDFYLKLKDSVAERVEIFDRRSMNKRELEQWIMAKEGKAKIVLGPRSTIFAPVQNLGLIVIYHEENTAYKQEQSPFYHVRDVAFMRSKIEKSCLLFVSAAPSAEIWWMAKEKKIKMLSFYQRQKSKMQIIDLSNYHPTKSPLISVPLRNNIQETLESKKRILLFMNRKGFTTLTRCSQCDHTLKCERCHVNLTYLYSKKKMVCRYCNYTRELPKVCPQCKGTYLHSTGTGIEKLESDIARLFPGARVERLDKETQGLPRKFDILIATQAILKYRAQLSVHLIGVVRIDSELNYVDFRSSQKTFSLMVSLSHIAIDKMMIQTRFIDNYCLKAIRNLDFTNFYENELNLRRELNFPPFKHLVSVGLRSIKEDIVFLQANNLFEKMQSMDKGDVELLEPHPDGVPKLRGKYRMNIMLKGESVKQLLSFIKEALKGFKRKRNVIITINVDP